MARIKFGALVTEIRGKIGGTVFQRNAYGYTVKNKANMIKPNTGFQITAQRGFINAVKLWSTLTDTQRALWENFASTYPQYSKFNPASVLSAFSVCVKRNSFVYYTTNDTIVTDPVLQSYDIPSANPHCELSSGQMYVNANFDPPSNQFVVHVFMSRPVSATQNFAKSHMRYIASMLSQTELVYVDTAYVARFGQLPAENQYVFVGLQLCGDGNGQVPAMQVFKLQVIAV